MPESRGDPIGAGPTEPPDGLFATFTTAPANAAGQPGAVIRAAADGGYEMVNLIWGFEPLELGGKPRTVFRSEGRLFPENRCLIAASEFYLPYRGSRFRFTLADRDWFYYAGLWRPATEHWPAAYAILTIPSNPDLLPYRDRQMAVIRRKERMSWLEGDTPEEVLRPLRSGPFTAQRDTGEL
jgi:putative SOS response-associated peptidase YedK